MSISQIEFITPELMIDELGGPRPGVTRGAFADWLAREMDAVNEQIQTAEVQVQQLVTGESDNLHQVMLSLEKAKLEFEMVLQVRNRLLEGYQEIMRMQI